MSASPVVPVLRSRSPLVALRSLALGLTLGLAPSLAEAAQGGRQGARPRPPSDPAWEDPAAVEAGREALTRVLVTAGTVPTPSAENAAPSVDATPWGEVLPGLSWQVLETTYRSTRPLRDPEGPGWSVNYRVPRLARFLPSGDGYVYSEYVGLVADGQEFRREFRRDVVSGDVIWAEHGNAVARSNQAVLHARWLLGREFLLGALPHSLVPFGAELARVGDSPGAEGPGGESAGPTGLYAVRLNRHVRPFDNEWMREFYLTVDESEWRILQLQFQLVDTDRPRYIRPLLWGFCDIDAWGELPLEASLRAAWQETLGGADATLRTPERLLLPTRRTLWREEGTEFAQLSSVEQAVSAMPERAFERPWLTQSPYVPARKPDHWDPPAPSAQPESKEPVTPPAPTPPSDRAVGQGR